MATERIGSLDSLKCNLVLSVSAPCLQKPNPAPVHFVLLAPRQQRDRFAKFLLLVTQLPIQIVGFHI